MKQYKSEKNNFKGITLIALVVTIVVLLILAAVSIQALVGENGLISRTTDAKRKSETARTDEEKSLHEIESKVNNYVGNYDEWNGTDSKEPTIKNENEIYIYTCAELKWLADKVNNGEKFDNYTVYLMNNLDFKARKENENWETDSNNALKWTPIGSNNNDNSYRLNATFEGNSHIIKGIYVNSTNNFNGIFGNANTIKNLTVRDSYIKGESCTAGIVGALREGELLNCYVENTNIIVINTNSRAIGGIVGQFTGTNISDCGSSATISATSSDYSGGIAGFVPSNATITRCYNHGKINSRSRTGGILGGSNSSIISVNLSSCYNTGDILGSMYTGGIAGLIDGNMNNCYNSGNITSTLSMVILMPMIVIT